MIDLKNVTVLDLETTGFGSASEVLEVGIIDGFGNTLLHTKCGVLHNTEWPNAEAVNGISPADVEGMPPWEVIFPQVIDACEGKDVIIYNKSFDLRYCSGLVNLATSVQCCMLRFAEHYGVRHKNGKAKWQKLEKAAAVAGFDWAELKAHCALSDVLATLHVWKYLDEKGAPYA